MFASIVVGTDGSETAGEAVRKAVELARVCGPSARLHVVTAYKALEAMYLAPEVVGVNLSGLIDPRSDAQNVVDDAAAKIRAEGIEVETHLRPGDAASGILDVAESAKADVIVVGNRGMGGVARFLLGSVPNKVAHHAPCSVLIVRTC